MLSIVGVLLFISNLPYLLNLNVDPLITPNTLIQAGTLSIDTSGGAFLSTSPGNISIPFNSSFSAAPKICYSIFYMLCNFSWLFRFESP
jgi:hypothetical protein